MYYIHITIHIWDVRIWAYGVMDTCVALCKLMQAIEHSWLRL